MKTQEKKECYISNLAFRSCNCILYMSSAVLKPISLMWLKETIGKIEYNKLPSCFHSCEVMLHSAVGWWKNWGSDFIQENIMLPMKTDMNLWTFAFYCFLNLTLRQLWTFYSTVRENSQEDFMSVNFNLLKNKRLTDTFYLCKCIESSFPTRLDFSKIEPVLYSLTRAYDLPGT